MRTRFELVSTVDRQYVKDIELSQIPRVGDTVDIPNVSQSETVVRTVVWYPYDLPTPMVYIVLGNRRPNT